MFPVLKMLTAHTIVHSDYSHIANAIASLIANGIQQQDILITLNTGLNAGAEQLRRQFPDCVYWVNEKPRGFAANHNHAMRQTVSPYVALLNDDIILEPNTIRTMIDFLESNPDVGVASPAIIRADGSPQKTAYEDPSLLRMIYRISGLGHFTRQGSLLRSLLERAGVYKLGIASLDSRQMTRFVPVVVGVAMFARREAWAAAGLMDEDTKFYAEEFGWHKRMRLAGWKVAVVAETRVIHLNENQDLSGWRLAEHRKGILSYFIRYKPHWQQFVIRAVIAVAHGLRGFLLTPFDRSAAEENWQAFRVAFWKPIRDSAE